MALNKKCLYVDSLFPKGHRNYNFELLKILSKEYDVDVINYNSYYKGLPLPSNCKMISINKEGKEINQSGFFGRMRSLNVLKKTNKIFKKAKYDALIISSFDVYVMLFASFMFSKKQNIILIHHNTVDQICSNHKKAFCFNRYKNKFKHVVLEDFIFDYLKESNLINNNLFVVYHPLTISYNGHQTKTFSYNAVSLSNSTDEKIMCSIIEKESRSHLLENNNLKIALKTKQFTCHLTSIETINGFLDDCEYDRLKTESDFMLLFYPSNFLYRSSGVLLDSLSNRKRIICNDFLFAKSINNRYPNICFVVSSYEEMVDVLKNNKTINNEDFELFKMDRSESVILSQLEKCIGV